MSLYSKIVHFSECYCIGNFIHGVKYHEDINTVVKYKVSLLTRQYALYVVVILGKLTL